MKKIFRALFAAACVASLGACGDMLDNIQGYLDQGEHVYASKIDSLKAFSGYKQAQITGLLMYGMDTKKCVITWEPGAGSQEIDIERIDPVDVFTTTITGLSEASYKFRVITYDAEGRASLIQELDIPVYGDNYRNSLNARTVQSAVQDGDNLVVTFASPEQDAAGYTFAYLNSASDPVEIPLTNTSPSKLTLANWKSEGAYTLTTLYKPTGSFETFEVESTGTFPTFKPQVPKSGFQIYSLPGDLAVNIYGGSLTKAWDGIIHNDNFAHSWPDGTHPTPVGACFTFDMGASYALESFRLNGITRADRMYTSGSMKQWEIWGTDSTPEADGSYTGWTKLLTCDSNKPSGLPPGENTDEDIARFTAGEVFSFPESTPQVRYIRIKINELWKADPDPFIVFTELTFWERP